jgi:hypothetical protein
MHPKPGARAGCDASTGSVAHGELVGRDKIVAIPNQVDQGASGAVPDGRRRVPWRQRARRCTGVPPSRGCGHSLRQRLRRSGRTGRRRPGRMNTKPMGYCTVKGLGFTVLALPSRPSAHTYQLPADAGVET